MIKNYVDTYNKASEDAVNKVKIIKAEQRNISLVWWT